MTARDASKLEPAAEVVAAEPDTRHLEVRASQGRGLHGAIVRGEGVVVTRWYCHHAALDARVR